MRPSSSRPPRACALTPAVKYAANSNSIVDEVFGGLKGGTEALRNVAPVVSNFGSCEFVFVVVGWAIEMRSHFRHRQTKDQGDQVFPNAGGRDGAKELAAVREAERTVIFVTRA
jgi:hypothetical protein